MTKKTEPLTDREARQLALQIGGGAMAFVYPIVRNWSVMPGSWPRPDYESLIVTAFFVVLGLFLLRAASDPDSHRRLIWFAVWVNIVHGLLMGLRVIDQPRLFSHFMVGVVLILLIPTGGIAWTMGRKGRNPRLGMWAIKSVGGWILLGTGLGGVFGNIMASIHESISDSPEGMGFAMARIFSPIAGAIWGLFAGSIGAVIVAASHSKRAYALFMGVASAAPFIPYTGSRLAPMVLTAVVAIVTWLIARQFDPPLWAYESTATPTLTDEPN